VNPTALKIQQLMRWRRGYAAYVSSAGMAGPSSVQIQTVNRCNAACVACPHGKLRSDEKIQPMDDFLFAHVLKEIEATGTVRKLVLMLQNEPLLDRSLASRIRRAREILASRIRIVIVTNGVLLDDDRADELLRSGVDTIAVSIDAATEATFEKVREGLAFDKVQENTGALLKKAPSHGVSVTAKFLRQKGNEREERAFAQFWRAKGAAVSFHKMTNRAGTLDEFDRLRRDRAGVPRRALHRLLNHLVPCCPLPFSSLGILSDGRALLCCHDWSRSETMGDISTQSLREIWNGKELNYHRSLLSEGRAQESSTCGKCSLSNRFWGS
jgi:radical SAM protein with 4Fe4S-binding SPASM domain